MTPSLESVPELLRESVEHWWERASDREAFQSAYAALSPEQTQELPKVVACSEFIAAALIQDPQALGWLARHDDPSSAAAADEDYESRIAATTDIASAQQLLREWRRRQMMRIAWRDIAGRAPVRETLTAVSLFADAAVRAAVRAAENQARAVFGDPTAKDGKPVPFIVLGMGKLGGRELNFSSDIDLIMLFGEGGETTGARGIDNEEYFNRLARDVIRLLDARTSDGFVFRVDMRLRPFGDSGPLVVSLAALEDYLQQHGRDWERYAWIKARAIVGVEAYQEVYQEFVRPFVYRRYLDFGIFESLREMKAMIEREVSRRELDLHLKLGSGGIREIEFIVQSLQLIRGGSDRHLQSAELLKVLPTLASSKLMTAEQIEKLERAYLLLRKAENSLQMIRDEQTHTLPESEADRARLAMCLGAADSAAALTGIAEVRELVAGHFESLVFGTADSQKREEKPDATWLDAAEGRIGAELDRFGIAGETRAELLAALKAFRDASTYRRLDETGRRRLHAIIDRLLGALASQGKSTLVVQRVLRILEAIGTRSSYLALLKEQPAALDRLIQVCSISGFLSRQIADFPLLLDELIDAKAFDELPSREGFVGQLAARLGRLPADDPERQVEALRQFQKAAVFNVALADLTRRLPLMRVSDRLTDIAELIVQQAMDMAWQQIVANHGVPMCGESAQELRAVSIAVAGYGKLGGLELGYGSDLDLVFLHDSAGTVQMTQGEKSIENTLFFLRLGQRIVHLLTMHSSAGRLYEVDMRLRPNGKGGFLMTPISAFEQYQRQDAWTWEHQALLRARAVGGAPALRSQFETVRHTILTQYVRRDTLRNDVKEMRLRMRRELSRDEKQRFDIKQGLGGIADLEFLVQYWVLAQAHDIPELVRYSDNIRQLEGLAAAGSIDAATAEWLKEAYIRYRSVLHHMNLEGDDSGIVDGAPFATTRDKVTELWRKNLG